ncbi:MAG TPA: hypothetical protein VFU02_04625, partial [Polyangiaceae bacterium]|nr:hypothetical protein [Polyangiaceae bacterium]
PPPPPGGYYYEPPPPPPPPEDEGVRTHDGFYFRTGLGFGWGQVESKVDDFDATYTGSGWLFDLLLGGTIGNTVVIGGGFLTHEISDPELEVSSEEFGVLSEELNGGLGIVTLGPFVDFFFGPQSGGHIGSMIGLASIGLEGEDDSELSSGWGFSLFGGYDFWVSDQWALGVNGRYMYAKGEREFDTVFSDGSGEPVTVVDTAHTFGVMFSALYH